MRCEEPWDQGNGESDKVFPEWSALSALLALTQRAGGVIRWPQSVSQPLDQAGWQSLGTGVADSIYGINCRPCYGYVEALKCPDVGWCLSGFGSLTCVEVENMV